MDRAISRGRVNLISAIAVLTLMAAGSGVSAAETVRLGAYICAGERHVVARCGRYCQVDLPDRPLRNGFMQWETEDPVALADRLHNCRYVADGTGGRNAANPAPAVSARASAPSRATAARLYTDPSSWYAMSASAIDLASRRRNGSTVAVTEHRLAARAFGGNHWTESTAEFDCGGHRQRYIVTAVLPLDRAERRTTPTASWQNWEALPVGSSLRAMEDFLCRDKLHPRIQSVADFAAFQRAYHGRLSKGDLPR